MLVDTDEALDRFLDDLSEQELVAYDVETSGLDVWHGDGICGMSFCFADDRTFYLPVGHARGVPAIEWVREKTARGGTSKRRVERDHVIERRFSQLSRDAIVRVFEVIRACGIGLITHNGKFDIHMTTNEGIDCSDIMVYDTMVMAKIANNIEFSVALKKLAVKYVDKNANDEEQALKKTLRERGWLHKDPAGKRDIAHYDWFEPAEMAPYAEKDALLTYALYRVLHKRIAASKQMEIFQRETALLPVLVDMERHGMRVDLAYCRTSLETVVRRIADVEESIFALAGEEFDIASSAQIGRVMARLGVTSAVRTPGGKESWAKTALEPSRSQSPIVPLIETWRSLTKTRTTYLENFLAYADSDGVIHTDIQQIEAVTGRTSSRNPNLQNITKKEKDGIELRRCFVPAPGRVFVLIDWSQMEARIIADWAGEREMLRVIEEGGDIHILTAMRIADVMGLDLCGQKSCAEMRLWRERAKTILFALLFGMGAPKLATSLGISLGLATEMRDAFWQAYPKIARFARDTRYEASTRGYVRNRYGRLYRYPEQHDPTTGRTEFLYTHAAVDHKIQGTGADMAKEALIKVWKGMRAAGMKARIVGFVHDEIIIEAPHDEVDRVVRNAMRIMTTYPMFSVPIEAEASIAETCWAEKRAYTPAVVAA